MKLNAITHDGAFHADDVFSSAILRIVYGSKITITRTRDQRLIDAADIVFDVGFQYDHHRRRYDHHMPDAPLRDDGNPYSAVGLLWRHFGYKAIECLTGLAMDAAITDAIWSSLDTEVIQHIDAVDNGRRFPEPTCITSLIETLNIGTASDQAAAEEAFLKAVDIAETFLIAAIEKRHSIQRAASHVIKAAEAAPDPRLIVLDKPAPFADIIHQLKMDHVLFVVFPSSGSWGVRTVTTAPNTYENRKSLPAEWGGLIDRDLQKATGVPDAKFAHKGLFLAVAHSREGAIRLAKAALNS